ncbi:MAG: filamentous hemagglutinin N-terminal domain-containing protein, partial [Comamonas sp.]
MKNTPMNTGRKSALPYALRTPVMQLKLLPFLLAASVFPALAAPKDPTVVYGQVTFSQNGNVFSITNSPNAIINWGRFSIAQGEVTRFIQQSGSSAVLNRITGQDPSLIMGALQSNGHVYLINPNGVLFGPGAQVNVNGLIASTLDIANADFLAGRNKFFAGANAGSVVNDGAITTPSGGKVFLIAPDVANSGIITSPQGEVVLAAGHSVQLADSSNPGMHVVVSAPADQGINIGKVIAQGGRIGIYGALVNQRGTVNANSAVVGEDGKIVFKASRDTLLEAGSVTSATGAAQGGEVSVLGQRVALTGDARVDARGQTGGGTVLVGGDYQGKNAAVQNAEQTVVGMDASIQADAIARGDGGKIVVWADGATSMAGRLSARGGASGGDGGLAEASGKQFLDFRGTADLRAPQGKAGTLLLDPNNISINQGADTYIAQPGGSPFVYEAANTPAVLTPATLQLQLGLSDVNVYTGTGSITVLSPVNWSNANELTLSATTGIAVNSAVTNTGGGKLSLYTTGGNISQTSPISVPTLAAIADTGSVALTHYGNTIGTLAGSSALGFSFADADALRIGTVAGGAIPTQTGIMSSNGDINIVSGAATVSGGLAIDSALSAPSGKLNLRTYLGDISQSAALIAREALIIADDGAVTLNRSDNSLDVLAGYSNDSVGGFSFVNSGALSVGAVQGSHGVLSFGSAPLSLTALTGDLTVDSTTYGVQAGTNGKSALALTASGGKVLGAGLVVGGAVTLHSATGIDLTGTDNAIGTLSASVSGSGNVALLNKQALSIASISTTAANATIDISTATGSDRGIEVAGPIGASASVSLNAGGSGAITRTGASSVISTNRLTLQETSSGAIGTSALPLLTRAVAGATTDLQVGTSGAGPQGVYLSHTGKLSLDAASHYGSHSVANIQSSADLSIAGNLNASTVDLTLDTAGSLNSDNSSVITGGNVTLSATQNISVGSVVSSTGNVSMTAQQALTARGISTSALNAGNVTLTANGGDMQLGADSAIDARSSAAGTHGSVSLTSSGAIQMLGGNAIKAGTLDIKAANGIYGSAATNPLAIMSDSVQAQNTASGPIRLANSGTDLAVGGTSNYGIQQQGAGDVNLGNASGYTTTINKAVSSGGGGISIMGAGGITLAAAQTIASQGGGIQLFAFDANAALNLANGSSVDSSGGLIGLKADAMSFAGSALHAGSGGVAIGPGNGDTQIHAGVSAVDVSGAAGTRVLGLSEAELRAIDTSGYIYLGNGSQTADLVISSALDLYNGGALTGWLSLNGGGGNVVINDALTTARTTIANSNASKTITIADGGHLNTFGTTGLNTPGSVAMNGNGSIATNGNALFVQGTTGVVLNGASSISTAGGGLTLNAGSLDGLISTQAGTSISSGAAEANLLADNMSLAGTIASTSRVILAPHTAGVQIKVGALAGDSSGVLRLTSSELNGVHAPVLQIGSSTAGAVAIESALGSGSGGAFEHVGSALKLHSGSSITQSVDATIGGIGTVALVGASVTLDQANDTGRIAGTTSGAFNYRSANQVSVEAVDGIHGISADAGQTIRLKSDGAGIRQNADAPLTVAGGTLVLEAAGPAELDRGSNSFAILGGVLNLGTSGTQGQSKISTASNLSVGSATAMDGVTAINGLSTHDQDLKLSTGAGAYQLNVDQPINVGAGSMTLQMDNLLLNDTVTGNTVVLQTSTAGRAITVGSSVCQVGGAGDCLAITGLDRVITPTLGIGQRHGAAGAPGDIHVAGITAAGTAPATDVNAVTRTVFLGSGANITQSGPIVVDTLTLSAGGNIALGHVGNAVSTLAAETNGTTVAYSNSAGFTVGALPANTLLEAGGGSLAGVQTLGGNVALTVAGGATSELAISQRINAGSGDVTLTSS